MDEDLVAYCGLYCSDCFGYKGTVADLARDLRKELRQSKFDRFAEAMPFKEFQHYKESYEVLGAMVRFRCKKACRGGGGPPFCNIRKCCLKNGLEGCWKCDQIENCDKLKFLEPVHKDAHIKNLKNIRKVGTKEWITGKRFW